MEISLFFGHPAVSDEFASPGTTGCLMLKQLQAHSGAGAVRGCLAEALRSTRRVSVPVQAPYVLTLGGVYGRQRVAWLHSLEFLFELRLPCSKLMRICQTDVKLCCALHAGRGWRLS